MLPWRAELMLRCDRPAVIVLLLLVIFSTAASADTINLGLISFDVLLPADGGNPGANSFNIVNFTGNPSSGGFALPPDFPAFTALPFLVSSLTVTSGGSSAGIPLGIIPSGPIAPLELQFPDTTLF